MNEMTTETLAANADAVIDAAPEGTATPTDTAPTETNTSETQVDAPQETETPDEFVKSVLPMFPNDFSWQLHKAPVMHLRGERNGNKFL